VKQSRRIANTYVVCLDCGQEMPYSWPEMRVMKERRRAQGKEEVSQVGLAARAEA
jgi:hypothetical protein